MADTVESSKPFWKKWWFWVGIALAGLVLQKGGSTSSISYKEWFFKDSTNFATWKNSNVGYARSFLNSLTLHKDSTFVLIYVVEGYGPVQLTGRYAIGGMYNIHEEDYLLKKELNLREKEYRKIDVKWDNETSSFNVLGNPYVGMPYRLVKPGTCGNRNYNNFYDYFIITEDPEGKQVASIGVIYMSCQEGTGKQYRYINWLER
jgi:hypothetical protein